MSNQASTNSSRFAIAPGMGAERLMREPIVAPGAGLL